MQVQAELKLHFSTSGYTSQHQLHFSPSGYTSEAPNTLSVLAIPPPNFTPCKSTDIKVPSSFPSVNPKHTLLSPDPQNRPQHLDTQLAPDSINLGDIGRTESSGEQAKNKKTAASTSRNDQHRESTQTADEGAIMPKTVEDLHKNRLLWYKLHIFMYDHRNFRSNEVSRTRLDILYFSDDEARTLRNTTIKGGSALQEDHYFFFSLKLPARLQSRAKSSTITGSAPPMMWLRFLRRRLV
ncbi:uncharacterized protein BDR25DRAFT_357713 [Lindgomyces ingoldianus]|uniref:Uncharacterized protein n=1 Tax=Lindgomyces ingoldianus TaxID=673940 RepID=A0ACB6QNB1_9PLEO|nr:uncharacterized protein BDR25DRAFT_357713 [Lindgomyces ingoldianus]KAF2468391.1 hypothetical protein BDR25DRAFT_357713 [Lindgomyces ingoldianus]